MLQPENPPNSKAAIQSPQIAEIQRIKKITAESSPEERLGNLRKISDLYEEIEDFQQMKYYAEFLLQTAQELNRPIYTGIAYQIISSYYFYIEEIRTAIPFVEKAFKIFKSNQYDIGVLQVHKCFGFIYHILGDYEIALRHYLKAKAMNDAGYPHKSDPIEGIDLLNRIGGMYHELDNIQKALSCSKASYELLEELEKVAILPELIPLHTLRGLAKSYSGMNNFQLAFYYLDKFKVIVDDIVPPINQKKWITLYQAHLGDVYYQMNQFTEASFYYELAIKNLLEGNVRYFILAVISKMGNCYTQLRQYNKAIQVLQTGFPLEEIAAPKSLLLFYETLHKTHSALGNFKEAHKYLLKYIEIKETTMGVERTRALEELEQKVAKERQEKNHITLELKALRAQMNPHFIFNSLNAIQHFIADEPNSQQAQRFLADFALLIRKTLEHSEISLVSVEEELNFLQSYLSLEQLRLEHKFDFFIEIDDTIDIEMIEIPPMLLQPYVGNALLHGILPKKGKGRIHIQLTKSLTHLIFVITDNGIGRAATQVCKKAQNAAHKSMGLQIQTNRLKAVNALSAHPIEVDIIDLFDEQGQACGTEVELQIPF